MRWHQQKNCKKRYFLLILPSESSSNTHNHENFGKRDVFLLPWGLFEGKKQLNSNSLLQHSLTGSVKTRISSCFRAPLGASVGSLPQFRSCYI